LKQLSHQVTKLPLGLYFLYETIWHALIPFVLVRLFWRSRKNKEYRSHLGERFGFYGVQQSLQNPVWIHAVSVGETHATQALIETLLKEGRSILLTHMTPTGRKAGSELYRKPISTGQLNQAYLPYDICWAIESFLKHFRPQLGLLMETEAWPGFVFRAKQLGIPLFLINARLSERSFKRVQYFGKAGQVLFQSFTGIMAQSKHDADRYQALGVQNLSVVGNMKFDITSQLVAQGLGKQWKKALQDHGRLAVCAASTRAGEEDLVVRAWKCVLEKNTFRQQPLLILVPRHPDRFTEVAEILYQAGLSFERRTNLSDPRTSEDLEPSLHWAKMDVLLGDTMGEMAAYYSASDFVVMGGSLLPTGGQNLIEACANACPVILGEHTYNFQKASEDAIHAGAAIRVSASSNADLVGALAKAMENLLLDFSERHDMARRAVSFAAEHQGASQRILNQLRPALHS
jgi:3-deoxy-D-manno-octulosonic-acid transferase